MIKKWSQFNENQNTKLEPIDNDKIDFSILTNLTDERDSIVEGDEVLATFFSGSFDTYDSVVRRYGEDYGIPTILNYPYDFYDIMDSYHIVKKETYNDFVGPEKRL